MSDNTTINPGTGGDVVRDKDRSGVKTQVFGLDINIGGATEQLMVADPSGGIPINNGYQPLLYDSWSAALDTVDKWTVTGNAPAITGGNMVMSPTVSTYNTIRGKDVLRPNAGFTLVRNGISIETATATGAGRFWGLGTNATTPAPGVLVQDGVGFELDQATGALLAVTYTAGARTTVATLTRPTDGAQHAYGCYFRVTSAIWVIDNVEVARIAFPNVTVVELPPLIVRQNAGSFTGTPSFVNIAHMTADTSRQGMLLADPVIGTRQARVSAAGRLAVDGPVASAAATSNVTGAATDTQLVAANANRRGLTIFNDSTAVLLVKFGTGASATSYTVPIAAGGYYEMPPPIYQGQVNGIWATANGAARLTELT